AAGHADLDVGLGDTDAGDGVRPKTAGPDQVQELVGGVDQRLDDLGPREPPQVPGDAAACEIALRVPPAPMAALGRRYCFDSDVRIRCYTRHTRGATSRAASEPRAQTAPMKKTAFGAPITAVSRPSITVPS